MKRFGICFSTRSNSMKHVAFVDAISDQGALFWFQLLHPHDIHCIHNVVEWQGELKGEAQGDPNGQYILTAA